MAFDRELDERQMKAVELIATGETISNTANLVGVNRKTIGEWKKLPRFKAEVDKQVATVKSRIEKKILSNVNPLLDKLITIALKSKSDKTSLDAIIYALNRLCGTPTSKSEKLVVGDNIENNVNIDKLLHQVNSIKNKNK